MKEPETQPGTMYEGELLFKDEPELLVAEVWHRAAKLYQSRDSQMEFVNGYINARRRSDERRTEKNSADESEKK